MLMNVQRVKKRLKTWFKTRRELKELASDPLFQKLILPSYEIELKPHFKSRRSRS